MSRAFDDPPELRLHLEVLCVIARAAWWRSYADGYMAAREHFNTQSQPRECTADDLGLTE